MKERAPAAGKATFADDVAFLSKYAPVSVLESDGGGRIAVSPTYQGRVMTSAITGESESLGWVHRDFIAAGKTGTPFDNFGGEDRFWLGPEGGQFGLYFPPGAPFAFDAWQTPAAFQQGAWVASARSRTSITFTRTITVTNYARTTFQMEIVREVRALSKGDIARKLDVPIGDAVKWVAFETVNTITNTSDRAWVEASGLPSIWILGQFAPAADAKIIIPFDEMAKGPAVNDAYFGKVPAERLRVDEKNGVLVFTADGKERGKIGLDPARAKSVAASYSASSRLLTIVQYDKPEGETRYVNSMWEQQARPFAGDVINAYNDGPSAPGKPSLGGFYELETSSPAAALTPGKKLVHAHRTFHFVGDVHDLEPIADRVLGASDALTGNH